MLKWILGVVIAIALLLIIGVVILLNSVDSLAKSAIEKAGTYASGVTTTVDGVDIGLMSGEMTITGLEMANPEGYKGPFFLRLGEADAAVSLGSLRQDVIEIPRVHLDGIHLNVELKGTKMNFQKIQEHLQTISSGKSKEPAAAPEEGKGLIIREIVISNTKVRGSLDLIPGAAPIAIDTTIPTITVKDIGTGQDNGAQLDAVINETLKALIAGALKSVGEAKGSKDLKKLGKTLGSDADDSSKGLVEGLGGLLGGKKKKSDDKE